MIVQPMAELYMFSMVFHSEDALKQILGPRQSPKQQHGRLSVWKPFSQGTTVGSPLGCHDSKHFDFTSLYFAINLEYTYIYFFTLYIYIYVSFFKWQCWWCIMELFVNDLCDAYFLPWNYAGFWCPDETGMGSWPRAYSSHIKNLQFHHKSEDLWQTGAEKPMSFHFFVFFQHQLV